MTAAIFMGSAAGALLGGAYLTVAGVLKPSPRAVATAIAAPPLRTGSPSAALLASARAPLAPTAGVVSGIAAAKPFHFLQVASGATDLQCLTEAVYFESRGEPVQGQKAVAQVVLNRVRHPAFPKTICGVVHQRTEAGCQFSFACAVEPRGRNEDAWKRARTIAQAALHGAVMRQIGDATHFESVRAAAFAGLLRVAQIGEHVFYRFGGRDGSAGMFHQTPAPSAEPKVMVATLTGAAPTALATTHATAPDGDLAASRFVAARITSGDTAGGEAQTAKATSNAQPTAPPAIGAPAAAKPVPTPVAVAS